MLDNAIKYSDMDTEISISLMCKNEQAIVIVKDQGHGFDNKEILNLLKRFERGQKKCTRGHRVRPRTYHSR